MKVSPNVGLIVGATFLWSSLVYLNYDLILNPVDLSALTNDVNVAKEEIHGAEELAVISEGQHRSGEALNRPLFNVDRRPFLVKAFMPPGEEAKALPDVQQEIAPLHLGLKLVGTRNINGVRSALVQGEEGGQPVWVSEGETVAGWTLIKSDSNASHFSQGSHNIVFQLYNE